MDERARSRVKTLIAGLTTENEKLEFFIRIIVNLAAEEEWRKGLSKRKLIGPLVGFINNPNCEPPVRMLSTFALANLSLHGNSTKDKIMSAGIVPALVNLFIDLQSNEDVLEKMLWLITNLTLDHPENRKTIGQSQFLESILPRMIGYDEDVYGESVISNKHLYFSAPIVAGAIRPLVNLFYDLENQDKFLAIPGSLERVIGLLYSESSEITSNILDLVLMLTAMNKDTRDRAIKMDAVPRMVELIEKSPIQAQEGISKIFCNLACQGYSELLAKEGAIYPLVGLLKQYAGDDSEAVDSLQKELVSTLSAASHHKKIRKQITRSDGVPHICQLLSSYDEDDEVLAELTPLIVNMTMEEKSRAQVEQAGVVPKLEDIAAKRPNIGSMIKSNISILTHNLSFKGTTIKRPKKEKEVKPVTPRRRLTVPALLGKKKAPAAPTKKEFVVTRNDPVPPSPREEESKAEEEALELFMSETESVDNYRPKMSEESFNLFLKRKKAVQELIDTEIAYVRNLEMVINKCLNPLRSKHKIIDESQLEDIFSVFENIYDFNKHLLDEMLISIKPNIDSYLKLRVGGFFLFLSTTSHLKEYSTYVNNYDRAIQVVNDLNENNKKWSQFNADLKAKDPEWSKYKLPLAGYLIQPVQRIPRYILLLKEVIKNTPLDHPDAPKLEQALKRLEDTASYINEQKRKAENMQALSSIKESIIGFDGLDTEGAKDRKLLREGVVLEMMENSKKSSAYVYIFLFDDILVKTLPMDKRGSLKVVRSKAIKSYKFSDSYVLAQCRAFSVEDTLDMKNAMGLEMESVNKKCVFFLSTPEERDSWLRAINKQIKAEKSK